MNFTQKELNSGLRKGFEITERYSRVINEMDSINWKNFKSKAIKLGVISERLATVRKPSIVIKNGNISGDLIITRMSETVEELTEIKISDCQVSGKVKLSGVRVKKIEVIGDFNRLELINLSADEIYVCGEIKELMIRNITDKKVDVEVNGFADKVTIENNLFHALEFLTFRSNSVRIRNIEGERLNLPKIKRRNIKSVGVINL